MGVSEKRSARKPTRKCAKRKAPVSLLALMEAQAGKLKTRLESRAEARSAVTSVGDTAPRIAWDSGEISVGDTQSIVAAVEGDYDSVRALIPDRGTSYTEYPGFVADSAKLTRRRGDIGRLTITLVTSVSYFGSTASSALRTKWEIEMAQIEKPIFTHKSLNIDEDTQLGLFPGEKLKLWSDEQNRALRDIFKFEYNGSEEELSENEIVFARKILHGVESFLIFAPVVSKTTLYDGRPDTQECGIIETPTESVDGYEYLKTADRVVQNDDKTWTRTEQWTGADEWDADLYGA